MFKNQIDFYRKSNRLLISIAWNGQTNLGRIDMLKILRLSIHEYYIYLGDIFRLFLNFSSIVLWLSAFRSYIDFDVLSVLSFYATVSFIFKFNL